MNLFNQFLIALSLFLIVNYRAQACAVCFSGREETLEAFYLTTVFLTLLPLVMLSSIGYWLYHKYRKGK
tara:strand:+ start:256 stop:462 length:207 start_codon:yes stop_codon:yes gene_type:complete